MTDITSETAVIVLAAGKGTRMKSDQAKVLHELNEVPMINYVARTALSLTSAHLFVVVGHQAEKVEQVVGEHFSAHFVRQAEQNGTGHAVQCALPYLPATVQQVVILCGDVPLLTSATVKALLGGHLRAQNDITVLAVNVDNPTGYGRVLVNASGQMEGIVEEVDANAVQKELSLINSGIYCVNRVVLEDALGRIKADNAQKEFYLTDIVSIGYRKGLRVGVEIGKDPLEVIGINTAAELARAEGILLGKSGETA